MKPHLRAVPVDTSPEAILESVVPQLAAAEELVRKLRIILAEQGRVLARRRGVAFLREEHLRREFGLCAETRKAL